MLKVSGVLRREREEKSTFPELRVRVFVAVESCSKALFRLAVEHGKSPWFSRASFLVVAGVDWAVPVLATVNVGVFLECAF